MGIFVLAVITLLGGVAAVENDKAKQVAPHRAQIQASELVDAGREDILTKKRYCERVKYRVKLCWDIKRVR